MTVELVTFPASPKRGFCDEETYRKFCEDKGIKTPETHLAPPILRCPYHGEVRLEDCVFDGCCAVKGHGCMTNSEDCFLAIYCSACCYDHFARLPPIFAVNYEIKNVVRVPPPPWTERE